MKPSHLVVAVVALLPAVAWACGPGTASFRARNTDRPAATAVSAAGAAASQPPGGARVTIPVSGMHCEHCISRLQTALQRVDGVKSVEATLAPGQATISYDADKVKPSRLAEAIDATGFTAGKPAQD